VKNEHKEIVLEFGTVFVVTLDFCNCDISVEPHRSWSKHHRFGNQLPFCYHLRHYLDLGKVTRETIIFEFSKVRNNRKGEKWKF